MTPEDKQRLEDFGKFGVSIADREWIMDLIKRQDEEIARLKESKIELAACLQAKDQQLDRERGALTQFAEQYPCHCAINYPGSTEYHSYDCRNAVVQEFVAQYQSREQAKGE